MYRQPSKQKQLTTRILIYSLMIFSIIGLVVVLVLVMLGYRFDGKDGTIEQTGLIQFSSTPGGATVEVDGKNIGSKTSTKASVAPGAREFVVWREGYQTWRKTLTIQSGSLTALNYTRLVPKQLDVKAVAPINTLTATLFSPGGNRLLTASVANSPNFTLYDLQDDNNIKQSQLEIPNAVITDANKEAVSHEFTPTEWDQSGRYILISHKYGDKQEWLIMDRQDPAQTRNISTAVNLPISEAHLSGDNGNIVFVKSGTDVRRIDVASGTISRPLASNIDQFSLYGTNVVVYSTVYNPETKLRQLGVVRDGDKEPHVLKQVTEDPSVPASIATSHYFGQDYVAMSVGSKVEILTGSYPATPQDKTSLKPFASFDAPQPLQWLQFSGNGRFVIAQTGASFVSYDLERQTLSAEAKLAGEGVVKKLEWLDDFMVWSDRSNTLTIREYDGANENRIATVATGFEASLSQNGKFMYSIGKTEKGYQLQRVQMILN